MSGVFTQTFDLWKIPNADDSGTGIKTRKTKDEVVFIKKVSGILSKKSTTNIVQTDSGATFGSFKQLNIRLDPETVELDELSEGDQLRDEITQRGYLIKTINPVLLPPDFQELLHITCKVTDNTGINEAQDNN